MQSIPSSLINHIASFLDQKSWTNFRRTCKDNNVPDYTLCELIKPPLEIISKFKGVRKISLYDTKISDISALSECKQLRELSLNRTKVSDISALSKCKQLQVLWLNDTDVSKEQITNIRDNIKGINI